ncbi:MAG: M48 family metallopeptidase [Bryobacteraceae bacterium]|nr:M48 family metallopeptidase [Bryobacteraceae bacterium]
MRPPFAFFLIASLLLAGLIATSLAPVDRAASFSAVLEMWGDVLRDVDAVPLQMVRVQEETEMEFGAALAASLVPANAPLSPDTRYLIQVGNDVARHVKRTRIIYHFRVIDSSEVNAFALPGGYVFVHRGLLAALRDESQLAAILGHEIAHIDQRHCVERFQYELKLKELRLPEGGGALTDAVRRVGSISYAPYQEYEADTEGQLLAARAGYDPAGGSNALAAIIEKLEPAVVARAPGSPVSEAATATAQGLSDIFRTHPRTDERMRRLRQVEQAYIAAHPKEFFCRGAKNLAERATCRFAPQEGEMVAY